MPSEESETSEEEWDTNDPFETGLFFESSASEGDNELGNFGQGFFPEPEVVIEEV